MPKTIEIKTSVGNITIELDESNTPQTAANFISYIKDKFYNDTIFHRVIPGFMIQGGGMLEDMTEKPTKDPIKNEADLASPNIKGSVAMARTNEPNSASSQFFINLSANSFLDHTSKTTEGWGYCSFGQVTSGMDIVEKIGQVKTTSRHGHSDVPIEPLSILEIVEI